MKKVVLLGDSITEGIGSKKINYEKYIREKTGYAVYNYSLTGTTIEHVKNCILKIKEIMPDILIIMYGSVDVQIRPNTEKNRFHIISMLPRRYKEIKGILNPRPFYSSRLKKKLFIK